ncbi:MAG: hypothetical protein JWN50_665 [Parcubacteria group bacterium]|nr:hypothetical protein [Parcubacteria group bacterium]
MGFRRFYYLFSLIFVFVAPSVFEWRYVQTHISATNLAAFIVGITVIGSLWDIWATRHGREDAVWLWQFNRKCTLGLTFFDLPIEEYVFYVATSVYVIFEWTLINDPSIAPLWIVPLTTIWSLFFIGLPYVFQPKN